MLNIFFTFFYIFRFGVLDTQPEPFFIVVGSWLCYVLHSVAYIHICVLFLQLLLCTEKYGFSSFLVNEKKNEPNEYIPPPMREHEKLIKSSNVRSQQRDRNQSTIAP